MLLVYFVIHYNLTICNVKISVSFNKNALKFVSIDS